MILRADNRKLIEGARHAQKFALQRGRWNKSIRSKPAHGQRILKKTEFQMVRQFRKVTICPSIYNGVAGDMTIQACTQPGPQPLYCMVPPIGTYRNFLPS